MKTWRTTALIAVLAISLVFVAGVGAVRAKIYSDAPVANLSNHTANK